MSIKDGKEQINCFSAMDKLATCASRLLRGSRSTPGFCSQNIEVSQINRERGALPRPGPRKTRGRKSEYSQKSFNPSINACVICALTLSLLHYNKRIWNLS